MFNVKWVSDLSPTIYGSQTLTKDYLIKGWSKDGILFFIFFVSFQKITIQYSVPIKHWKDIMRPTDSIGYLGSLLFEKNYTKYRAVSWHTFSSIKINFMMWQFFANFTKKWVQNTIWIFLVESIKCIHDLIGALDALGRNVLLQGKT